ncbi:Tripartite-type tricarboxylate transporter, receptor component TctC [Bosea sp. CRIB-10]|uniref:Bug family tripartite tricarboxylate transporter substrate binding protein n=1 Tax=Bosea sp. CRIB-10 TaxID=378404 RepID=UPI0008E0ECBB|nr:tripartite tricarboxylate transporter substrate binding protein [Bosea sp. CRIB-10]SFD40179.1 Tripartite-type tricarboxylate transporter, receptor component TctC [Bosea sp. CRIB-10]
MSFRFAVKGAICASLLALGTIQGVAADYPTRPIKLVVPYPAGGATDQLARSLGETMSRDLGQPIVVENKPGANTNLGAETVARAEPDGYSLLMASGANLVLNPLLYKKLGYDPRRDLRPLGLLAEVPLVVATHKSVPVKSVAELVAYLKANPNKLNFASVGIGNPLHLAVERFTAATGTRMTHVPYRGSAPALQDLVGGQVQLMFDTVSTSLPHVQAGALNGLAVTSTSRLAALPDVPTIAEAGYPGQESAVWFALALPKATPEAIVERLQRSLAGFYTDTNLRATLEKQGWTMQRAMSEADIAAFLEADRKRWGDIIASSNIALD